MSCRQIDDDDERRLDRRRSSLVAAVGDMAPGSRVSKQTMGEGTDLG